MLSNVLTYAHKLLKESLIEGDIAIDATCGNGYDTLFLSQAVGPSGKVYGFDIQEQAIQKTNEKLQENDCQNVLLIQDSHERLHNYIEENIFGGAIFNLGYLPKSDKSIVTKAPSTLAAIEAILEKLKSNGLVILVIYYGHPGGEEEKEAVLSYTSQLDQKVYQVLQYKFINQQNQAPFLIAIEKKKRS
ncbi:class I SAM-dependent methyltransferase [Oceanobacillus jeddahense]|uniref:Class I SAM-dependent methyltransferase n=1 Tax=Oceanobacillus jeddahense TaxID=1462527 RepID=A0ABY5JPZ9_9BACI|nr:class I SAM-dependent methyltransferase [Oceanobacillus jeddahense]UUI01894.1 class I SAM-dependent methyltransferase [Oceanobacillus jeddahense]